MDVQERQFVLDGLGSSETRLFGLVDGLSPEQWSFREAPDRWSIAENIEHLVVFEVFILGKIREAMDGPAKNEKKVDSGGKEQLVLGLAGARHIRFNSREAVRPSGRWAEIDAMLGELRRVRARTVAFACDCQEDLRGHFFPHIAFGDLDCYQWLVLIGQHMERHALQIEQVMADPGFPAR